MGIVTRQTGRMMKHYLKSSGTDYKLQKRIFTRSDKVQKQMSILMSKIHKGKCTKVRTYKSKPFHMAPKSSMQIKDILLADSIFGLYKGHIEVTTHPKRNGLCKLTWRAELPWNWPNFDDLYRKHGSYLQKERFPYQT